MAKIFWWSNSPLAPTGYGVQSDLFITALVKDGYEVTGGAFFGHESSVLNVNGVPILPKLIDTWGNDALPYYISKVEPDLTIALMDIWVLDPNILGNITSYLPIDHYPITPAVKDTASKACSLLAMSKFGQTTLKDAGLDSYYVPHAVDSKKYVVKNQKEEREKWALPEDVFIAIFVGANKGYPSRKSIPAILKAWSIFSKQHPDAVLYMHTAHSSAPLTIDLFKIFELYDIDSKTVKLADIQALMMGGYDAARMSSIYSAADVLISTSMAEGFGVPVVEAQMCGCPVIVTDFSAQSELVFAGWTVPIDPDDMEMSAQYSEQARPRVSRIVEALEAAYDSKGDKALRRLAHREAKAYDINRVYKTYLKPILPELIEKTKNSMFREVE